MTKGTTTWLHPLVFRTFGDVENVATISSPPN